MSSLNMLLARNDFLSSPLKKKLCGLKVLITVTVIQNAPGLTGFN